MCGVGKGRGFGRPHRKNRGCLLSAAYLYCMTCDLQDSSIVVVKMLPNGVTQSVAILCDYGTDIINGRGGEGGI
jgi:hypothetical protein